jgi:hypothetical protein
MIRAAIVAVLAVAGAACGGGAHAHTATTRPPDAEVMTAAGPRTLTLGSFCWSVRTQTGRMTGCGDTAGAAFIPDLRVVRVRRGTVMVVRFAFTPTAAVDATIGRRRYRLPAAATVRLRVDHPGLLTLDPRRGSDDVQYMARLVTDAS